MKYIGLLASSICVVCVLLVNSYYNIINLDIQKMSSYVIEGNMILEDFITREEQVLENKGEYISRLIILLKNDYKKLYSVIEKKAIENARYVFPNACETKIVCTMNLRSLINFCNHRCCRRAQEEINKLVWAMVGEIEKISPLLAKSLGAACQFGPCPEGDMCCMMPYPKK